MTLSLSLKVNTSTTWMLPSSVASSSCSESVLRQTAVMLDSLLKHTHTHTQSTHQCQPKHCQSDQLGHMQVCTSLRTGNHASTPPLCFLQAECPSCRPTNSVKALKAVYMHGKLFLCNLFVDQVSFVTTFLLASYLKKTARDTALQSRPGFFGVLSHEPHDPSRLVDG